MRPRTRSTSSMLLNSALSKQRNEKVIGDMEKINENEEDWSDEKNNDDISNNHLVRTKSLHHSVSFVGSMKKRTDSTATDYQSEDEFYWVLFLNDIINNQYVVVEYIAKKYTIIDFEFDPTYRREKYGFL